MNAKQKQLMIDIPLMKCSNTTEFKQRLQWLSEGMLRNHIEGIINYVQDQSEIDVYLKFKGAK